MSGSDQYAPRRPAFVKVAGVTVIATAAFAATAIVAARQLLPGTAIRPLPGLTEATIEEVRSTPQRDPVLTPELRALLAKADSGGLFGPVERRVIDAFKLEYSEVGTYRDQIDALDHGLERTRQRAHDLRQRLQVLDQAVPIDGPLSALLSEYRDLVGTPDAELRRWLARRQRVEELQRTLAGIPWDAVPREDQQVPALLSELTSLIGPEDRTVVQWRDRLAELELHREDLALCSQLAEARRLPADVDRRLTRLIAAFGHDYRVGDQTLRQWQEKVAAVRQLASDLKALHGDVTIDPVLRDKVEQLRILVGSETQAIKDADARLAELRGPPQPDWAERSGRDGAGRWADLVLASSDPAAEPLAFRFRYIPAGTVQLGSPPEEPHRDRDEGRVDVALSSGFWIASTELTQAAWQRIFPLPPAIDDRRDELPVTGVTWEQAQGYCDELNLQIPGLWARLPTEAEWACAARAGHGGPFIDRRGSVTIWSTRTIDDLAWHDANSEGRRHIVAFREANPFGLYDLHGNVWEWCSDVYGPYPDAPSSDWQGPRQTGLRLERVIRGGSFTSSRGELRVANREHRRQDRSRPDLGFRLVIDRQDLPDRSPHRPPVEPVAPITVDAGHAVVPREAHPVVSGVEVDRTPTGRHADGSLVVPATVAPESLVDPGRTRDRRRRGGLFGRSERPQAIRTLVVSEGPVPVAPVDDQEPPAAIAPVVEDAPSAGVAPAVEDAPPAEAVPEAAPAEEGSPEVADAPAVVADEPTPGEASTDDGDGDTAGGEAEPAVRTEGPAPRP